MAPACDSGSDFHSGIVGVGGIVQWRRVVNDGIIVEVMEVVGVEGSRVLFERFRPPHDTVLKRYRVAAAKMDNLQDDLLDSLLDEL